MNVQHLKRFALENLMPTTSFWHGLVDHLLIFRAWAHQTVVVLHKSTAKMPARRVFQLLQFMFSFRACHSALFFRNFWMLLFDNVRKLSYHLYILNNTFGIGLVRTTSKPIHSATDQIFVVASFLKRCRSISETLTWKGSKLMMQ